MARRKNSTPRRVIRPVAGPTGVPWVNSNAWFSLLAGRMAPGKTVWLDFDPPEESTLAHPANYPLAVADSEAYGEPLDYFAGRQSARGAAKADSQGHRNVEQVERNTRLLCSAIRNGDGTGSQGILTVFPIFAATTPSSPVKP